MIAPACHDTGSAVAAVPMTEADAAYISCGTWALLGAEIPEPTITPDVLAHNVTNDGGVFGTYRFLKNITGLWLVQECKRVWDLEGKTRSFAELTALAKQVFDAEKMQYQKSQAFESGMGVGMGVMVATKDRTEDPKHFNIKIERAIEHEVLFGKTNKYNNNFAKN